MAQPKVQVVVLNPTSVVGDVIVCAPVTTGARQRIMSANLSSTTNVTLKFRDAVGGTDVAAFGIVSGNVPTEFKFGNRPAGTEFGMDGVLLGKTNTTGLSCIASGACTLTGTFTVIEE